ncbi:hypothetical protein EON64_05905, partial [archaeon]
MSSCSESINWYDRARLTIYPTPNTDATIYDLYFTNEDCYKCSKTLIGTISNTMTDNICVNIWTPFAYKIYLYDHDTNEALNNQRYTFREKADYDINIASNSVQIDETKSPYPTYLPLFVLAGILGFLILCAFSVPVLMQRYADKHTFYTNSPLVDEPLSSSYAPPSQCSPLLTPTPTLI